MAALVLALSACAPGTPTSSTPDALRLAAATLTASVGWLAEDWSFDHEAVPGTTDSFAATDACLDDCGPERPTWTGELAIEVTWGADPAGACGCGGVECSFSTWSTQASGDVRVFDRLQGGSASVGDAPRLGVDQLDLHVNVRGTEQLGLTWDQEEAGCALAEGTFAGGAYSGTLTPVAERPVAVEVRVWFEGDTQRFEAAADGESTSWGYERGS